MANETDGDAPRDVSRRSLFKQVGAVGAAAMAGTPLATGAAVAQEHTAQLRAAPASPAVTAQLEALETLTAAEADTLEAIVARLIPSDENGPGATEARAAHYIDRALTGPLRSSREAYAAGLAAIDAYAQSKKGAAFARLAAPDQDAVLTDMEKNVATGFVPNAASFFNLVRAHTIQGTFCDPYYGGNADFVGWDLIGFPGLRMAVGEDEQRMKAPQPVRKSAYEDAMFTMKGGARGHRP
jgi:gluconate 2-dehydrogenase gamma chain